MINRKNLFSPTGQWQEVLKNELNAPYFKKLQDFVDNQYKTQIICPEYNNIFNAFNRCPFEKIKVVILGQDPYTGLGQAHGLSFSVPVGIDQPPSLRNILKEVKDDLGIDVSKSGDLSGWATQGVFLLNTLLTVRNGAPLSHEYMGWELFTDSVIKVIAQKKENIVFMLWGKHAVKKSNLIRHGHFILTAPHPSPLSAYHGFFGCKHFSKANLFLRSKFIDEIDWRI